MNDLAILRLADAMARHAGERHGLIAENVANADTPGYRSRDLRDFAAVLQDGFSARATRETHLGARDRQLYQPVEDAPFGSDSPNGNDVSLEDQLRRAAQAQGAHDRATTIYAKTMDIMRLGLGRR